MSRPKPTSKRGRSAVPKPAASACRIKGSKSPASNASASEGENGSFNACPLVMIEWEDSAQPIPAWRLLADFEPQGTLRCVSVGWLIQDDKKVKAVAPNMGGVNVEGSLQVSGVIQIPTSCVLKVTHLSEPGLICP